MLTAGKRGKPRLLPIPALPWEEWSICDECSIRASNLAFCDHSLLRNGLAGIKQPLHGVLGVDVVYRCI